ncbi:catalase [Aliidiomarina shirensis]|uniref:Catalase-related peroxidase n=1 Tax=Aliidiomarina shirensis TaxID=1048642 RepID=A0A432WT15_9GAMM|nr:catalase family peroxidase [Aliidiomarina shirensis]RUO36894.1 catalase [Aliidiomarina shirensis]
MLKQKPSALPLRYAVIIGAVGGLGALLFAVAGGLGQSSVTAQDFVNLQEGNNPHLGFRRAHAKGFCIAGEFVSNGSLQPYSIAPQFAATSTPFVGRISIAGNNPTAPDLNAPVRSLALSFGAGSSRWLTAMNTPPVMAVGTPEAFYQQIQALSPDPETGERNPERIQAFFATHPETQTFRNWQAGYTPTASFASEIYHSINAFYLINENGDRQAVRWAAMPTISSNEELDSENVNALQNEFFARVEAQPVAFDLTFTFANDSDDETNPTVLWPEDRQQVVAGQIVVHQAMPENEGNCNEINFDPLVLPKGMAATADPILRARSAAYAESYRRRAREHFLNSSLQPSPQKESENSQ